jgi:uncharacterized membrane protein HdeD (DUF308 family)
MHTRSGLIPRSSSTSLAWPIVLILIGVLALALPVATSFAVARILAWLLFFDGIIQFFYAFTSEGVGHILWKVLVGALYVVGGLFLLANPLVKMAALTLILAVFFIIEGIIDLSTYVTRAKTEGSQWLLIHSLVTIALGVMIWLRWPLSSLWAVGILAGVSILLNGVTRLLLALAIRRHAH